ncbi:hypothetical protein Ciccas_007794, partial [Cichlidogyrus casuarinus]
LFTFSQVNSLFRIFNPNSGQLLWENAYDEFKPRYASIRCTTADRLLVELISDAFTLKLSSDFTVSIAPSHDM